MKHYIQPRAAGRHHGRGATPVGRFLSELAGPRAVDRIEASSDDNPPAAGGPDFSPKDAVPQDAIPADAIPADAIPADAIPGDAIPADAIIDGIIAREGRKYTDIPDDRGGPTKFGITLKTLRAWRRDPTLTAADVMALGEREAHAIYFHEYITGPGFDKIDDDQLMLHVIDAGANHGQGWAARRLQEVCEAGLKIDGILGPKSLAAVNAADPDKLHLLFIAVRMKKYMRIVAADARARGCFEGQIKFLEGWGNRLAWFIDDEARV